MVLPLPNGDRREIPLTRQTSDALVMPTLERCRGPVLRALRDAGIEAAQLSGVILVGGATRMPIVRRFVAELFGREPLADIDPDEVVALGAAVQADLLASGGRSDVVLMDVVPLSLGLEMMGGVAEKLIYRNTTAPLWRSPDLHHLCRQPDRLSTCTSSRVSARWSPIVVPWPGLSWAAFRPCPLEWRG